MVLAKDKKGEILKKFGVNEKDTGSSEVQIALLTARIAEVTEHLKQHKKDFNSRRSLLMMVGRRRKLLNYVKKHDEKRFKKITKELKIRK
jgi:small subunit ribosomal protein S15